MADKADGVYTSIKSTKNEIRSIVFFFFFFLAVLMATFTTADRDLSHD